MAICYFLENQCFNSFPMLRKSPPTTLWDYQTVLPTVEAKVSDIHSWSLSYS